MLSYHEKKPHQNNIKITLLGETFIFFLIYIFQVPFSDILKSLNIHIWKVKFQGYYIHNKKERKIDSWCITRALYMNDSFIHFYIFQYGWKIFENPLWVYISFWLYSNFYNYLCISRKFKYINKSLFKISALKMCT